MSHKLIPQILVLVGTINVICTCGARRKKSFLFIVFIKWNIVFSYAITRNTLAVFDNIIDLYIQFPLTRLSLPLLQLLRCRNRNMNLCGRRASRRNISCFMCLPGFYSFLAFLFYSLYRYDNSTHKNGRGKHSIEFISKNSGWYRTKCLQQNYCGKRSP